MSEYALYLVTAILIAVSILSTRFVFAESDSVDLRVQAEVMQQDYRVGERSSSRL